MRNKHPGICYRCGRTVPPGGGHFERQAGKWAVIHAECVLEQRREKAAAAAELKHQRGTE